MQNVLTVDVSSVYKTFLDTFTKLNFAKNGTLLIVVRILSLFLSEAFRFSLDSALGNWSAKYNEKDKINFRQHTLEHLPQRENKRHVPRIV